MKPYENPYLPVFLSPSGNPMRWTPPAARAFAPPPLRSHCLPFSDAANESNFGSDERHPKFSTYLWIKLGYSWDISYIINESSTSFLNGNISKKNHPRSGKAMASCSPSTELAIGWRQTMWKTHIGSIEIASGKRWKWENHRKTIGKWRFTLW